MPIVWNRNLQARTISVFRCSAPPVEQARQTQLTSGAAIAICLAGAYPCPQGNLRPPAASMRTGVPTLGISRAARENNTVMIEHSPGRPRRSEA